jgi:hypothetical protein
MEFYQSKGWEPKKEETETEAAASQSAAEPQQDGIDAVDEEDAQSTDAAASEESAEA